MSKEEIILEFVEALREVSDLEYTKYILLSVCVNKRGLTGFLNKAFELVENERPKRIEMKTT